MGKTSIEWTDDTWNPVAGCSLVSPGCTNCYAMKMAARLDAMGQEKYKGLTRKMNGKPVWTGKIFLDEKTLLAPLSWKAPRRVFVNSMSDLFHQGVPDEFIDRVFAVMALCFGHHTFQILTKRAERMQEYMESWRMEKSRLADRCAKACGAMKFGMGWASEVFARMRQMPLPNVWLGVSVESPEYTDRMNHLVRTPAAVRFVSYEPALGPMDFSPWLTEDFDIDSLDADRLPPLDWIIVGGESGPDARAFDIRWAGAVVEQCRAAGVACFVKQLGANPHTRTDMGEHFKLRDRAGGDMAEWPKNLRVREFPGAVMAGKR